MSFHNGLKGLAALSVAAGLLAGCSSEPSKPEGPVKVLAPQGAPALAAMNTLGEGKDDINVEYTAGQDVLLSTLASEGSEYDLVFAPVNLGVKTWKEAGAYELEGIVTWGNLYIVSEQEDWNNESVTLAAFGEGAVPGLVFSALYPDVKAKVDYYPSVSEASQALLSGNADAALLAQPAAAAASSKGLDAGKNFTVVADLQQEWLTQHSDTGRKGYPQAAVFVKKGSEEKVQKALDNMTSFLEEADPAAVEAKVDLYGAEVLGVPNAKIAGATWQAQNIHYVKAAECKEDIQAFLDLFGMTLDEDMLVK